MTLCRPWRQLMVSTLAGLANVVLPQAPFELDTSFRTQINTWYVSSVAPQDDGSLLVSGQIKFPGDLIFRSTFRLLNDGSKDPSFPSGVPGGGKLTKWNDEYYVSSAQLVRRFWPDGTIDWDWDIGNSPYFSPLQGGDYHVYPDGRVLLTGYHNLDDTVRGFVGGYNLIWFSNQGYLDTTRTHRQCDGVIWRVKELSDGKFICTGTMSEYEGTPVGRVIRVQADGVLDTTFSTTFNWGYPTSILPQPDGKVILGGVFRMPGDPDTLSLVRLQPNGDLDPTFNNHFQTLWTQDPGDEGSAPVEGIYQLDAGRLIITGAFDRAEDQVRGAIALIDTAGNLLNDYFAAPGCGPYEYFSYMYGGIAAVTPDGNGNFYINGAYHGYNDGTTNDTLQRMVSRFYGLEVGVQEHQPEFNPLRVFPNPGSSAIQVEWDTAFNATAIELFDSQGRCLEHRSVVAHSSDRLDVNTLAQGAYCIRLTGQFGRLAQQWIKQ